MQKQKIKIKPTSLKFAKSFRELKKQQNEKSNYVSISFMQNAIKKIKVFFRD